MSQENKKSGLHIHLGGLIIIIIIALLLFRVDIKSKIDSPQFQKNMTYIENAWKEKISTPLREKASYFFMNFTQKGVDKLQENFVENVLRLTTDEDIERMTN